MTSELRPAMEVWRQIYTAWGDADPSFNDTLNQHNDDLLAASMIEADREAVRAEQAAELAKWKALAETLAGALGEIQAGTYPRPLGKPWRMDASSSKHDRCTHDAWMYETCEGCLDAFVAQALTSYKEQRDVAG